MHTLTSSIPTRTKKFEPIKTLSNLWKKHTAIRVAVGGILAIGAATAASGGTSLLAGGFLGLRALLGGIGGYMVTDAVFKKILNSKPSSPLQKVQHLVSGFAGTALAIIGGSDLIEIASESFLSTPIPAFLPTNISIEPPILQEESIGIFGAGVVSGVGGFLGLSKYRSRKSKRGVSHIPQTPPSTTGKEEKSYEQPKYSITYSPNNIDNQTTPPKKIRKKFSHTPQTNSHTPTLLSEARVEIPTPPSITPETPIVNQEEAEHLPLSAIEKNRRQLLDNEYPVAVIDALLANTEHCEESSVNQMIRWNAFCLIGKEFGFYHSKNEINHQLNGVLILEGKTPGGHHEYTLTQTVDGQIQGDFSWWNGGDIGYTTSRTFSSESGTNIAVFIEEFRKNFDDAFMETIVKRETIKQIELQNVHCFEITRSDLQKIYTQLETPGFGGTKREIGGFWTQPIYSIQEGVFRFDNLNNPTPDEIDANDASFQIKAEKEGEFISRCLSGIQDQYLPKESALIARLLNTDGGRFGKDASIITGATMQFNWHKHPTGEELWRPSGMDEIEATMQFSHFPSRKIYTWGIANEVATIPEWAQQEDSNTLVLLGSEFGGTRNYVITFWKMNRPNPGDIRIFGRKTTGVQIKRID